MKVNAFVLASGLLLTQQCSFSFAQTSSVQQESSAHRVAFVLKNNLGYHRMFRVEGPGIAYGFTMNRNEKTPKNWPVGSRLYFSRNGEDKGALILTVTDKDAGTTLFTYQEQSPDRDRDVRSTVASPAPEDVAISFRNNSFWFKRVVLISYKPGEAGNGTSIFTLAPYAASRRRFPVDTRIFFADDKQVDHVMSGGRLNDTPFLVIKKEQQGQTFDIFE
jgi:hypothetical protein